MTDENTSIIDSRFENVSWRRIANIVGVVLLVAIVVPFVIFAVPQVVGADQGYVVLSGSMEPAMSPGDVVIVNSVPASEIERNDVITFGGQEGDTPTTHRVIEVVEQDGTTAFRTQGDANDDPDAALVTPDQIQGKVVSIGGYLFVIPLIGYVINFAGTQSGLIMLVGLPVSLLVLNEIWNVVASARSSSDDDSGSDVETGGSRAAATAADTTDTEPANPREIDATEATGQQDSTAVASEEANAEISFTTAELQLGLGVNAAFLVYSIWVVYSIWSTYDAVEAWALGVTGGVSASFLLLTGLYIFGSTDDTTDGGAPSSGSDPQSGQPTPPSANAGDTNHNDNSTPSQADSDMLWQASLDPHSRDSTPPQANAKVNADDSDTAVAQQANGNNREISSKGDGGDPATDTNSTEGETDA